jgi:23S rRNA (uracil1939-C5)-methyltransferase
MSLDAGTLVTVDVERPVAGGWMLARHLGQVVFVSGAIPGERVVARVDRVARGTVYADAIEVMDASPDRRPGVDGRCGGTVYGHIAYARQLQLKAAVVEDAWRRLARQAPPAALAVVASPERGYRTRARLHASGHRLGFYREGSHTLCDAASTGQLSDQTVEWLRHVQGGMERLDRPGLHALELAENVAGTVRACHMTLTREARLDGWHGILSPLSGVSYEQSGAPAGGGTLWGEAAIVDEIRLSGRDGIGSVVLGLRHDVRSFFQGNRFLLPSLVEMVVDAAVDGPEPDGPVLDLYAGTGLFGLAVAATRPLRPVTLVEGDRWSGRDLAENARLFDAGAKSGPVMSGPVRSGQVRSGQVRSGRVRSGRVSVEQVGVERYVARTRAEHRTWIVDPPRQGLASDVRAAVLRDRPARVVYVSCDVATLARDVAALTAGGYEVRSVVGLDMFPSTAHVEVVCVLDATRTRG